MSTFAIPIGVTLVFATIYMAVPWLRERHQTRRKLRAAELYVRAQQQKQPISFHATEPAPSVEHFGWTVSGYAAQDGS